MVGDRRDDVEGARAHRLPAVGVSWGYGGPDELRSAGADRIVDDADAPAGALTDLLAAAPSARPLKPAG